MPFGLSSAVTGSLPFAFVLPPCLQPSIVPEGVRTTPFRTNYHCPSSSLVSTQMSSLQDVADQVDERTVHMTQRAANNEPWTDRELDAVLDSMQRLAPPLATSSLREFLQQTAHLSHKNWTLTEQNAETLKTILQLDEDHLCESDEAAMSSQSRQWLERCITDGHWDAAARHGAILQEENENAAEKKHKPFAVLVTGLNGIRKSTALYQPWFAPVLAQALGETNPYQQQQPSDTQFLPNGQNSFFRQLDHMIATLCNQEFAAMYKWCELQQQKQATMDAAIPQTVVKIYSDMKAAIFSRYRTLSEMLGIVLLQKAQKLQMNCLMETSGRDVAMFEYVDRFFDGQKYHKLVLHFQINDMQFAQQSVDRRMTQEIKVGMQALAANDTLKIVHANMGGPYGSEVLLGVQQASDTVWKKVCSHVTEGVGHDWLKATIQINAYADKPWTAQAVRPDGSLGTVYEFSPRN